MKQHLIFMAVLYGVMLNQVSHIVLSCVLLLLSVSCKNRQDLEKTLSGFVQSEVVVPDDLAYHFTCEGHNTLLSPWRIRST